MAGRGPAGALTDLHRVRHLDLFGRRVGVGHPPGEQPDGLLGEERDPSDTLQPAPVTASGLGIDSADPASDEALRPRPGAWVVGADQVGDAGAHATLVPSDAEDAVATTVRRAPKDVRVEADVRLADDDAAFEVEIASIARHGITVRLDPAAGELRVEARSGRSTVEGSVPLPSRYEPTIWTSLAVDVSAGRVTARLAESRLGDADAEVVLDLPPGAQKPMPVDLVATGGAVDVDNLTVTAAHTPVTEHVDEPAAGAALVAEEFDGEIGAGWTWVRPDDAVTRRRRCTAVAAGLGGRRRHGQHRSAAVARRPGRRVDRRDEARPGPRRRQHPQLPAGRHDRPRRRRSVPAAERRRHLGQPADRVRQGDGRGGHAALGRPPGRAGGADDVAAFSPRHRPGHRRAPLPLGLLSRRRDLAVGSDLDPARRHHAADRAFAGGGATPATTATFEFFRLHDIT